MISDTDCSGLNMPGIPHHHHGVTLGHLLQLLSRIQFSGGHVHEL